MKGRFYKHAHPGSDPLPLRDDPPDSRWQRGAVVDAIYLAESEETVWAEWYRALAEAGVPPREALPRDFWTWELDVELADLSTKKRLDRVRLPVPRPSRATWPRFQAIGEALFAAGWGAARPRGRIVCLFWRGVDMIPGATPLGRPNRVVDPPMPPAGMRT